MKNEDQEQRRIECESLARAINNMDPKVRKKLLNQLAIERRLTFAEIRELQDELKEIESIINSQDPEKEKKIDNAILIISTLLGTFGGMLAAMGIVPPEFDGYAMVIGGLGGAFLGGHASPLIADGVSSYYNYKQCRINKKIDKAQEELNNLQYLDDMIEVDAMTRSMKRNDNGHEEMSR